MSLRHVTSLRQGLFYGAFGGKKRGPGNEVGTQSDLGSADRPSSLELQFSVSIGGFGDTVFRHFPFVASFASGQQCFTAVILLLATTTATEIKQCNVVVC